MRPKSEIYTLKLVDEHPHPFHMRSAPSPRGINAGHVLQNTKKIYIGFTHAFSEVHFRSTESQTFYWSIMTADDSFKCRCANSGMTGQVGGFQNPGACLQAFPSFLPHPLPVLLLTPFFARCLTLVPRSLLLNCTETLATQARLCMIF